MKTSIKILAVTILLLTTSTIQAQFLKKLKNKVQQTIERTIEKKSGQLLQCYLKRAREQDRNP